MKKRSKHACHPGQAHADKFEVRRQIAARLAEVGNVQAVADEFGVSHDLVEKARSEFAKYKQRKL